jgi:predicted transcriptional regulator
MRTASRRHAERGRPVGAKLPPDLIERLDRRAEADDRTRSQIIRFALESYLAEQPEGRKAG